MLRLAVRPDKHFDAATFGVDVCRDHVLRLPQLERVRMCRRVRHDKPGVWRLERQLDIFKGFSRMFVSRASIDRRQAG